MRRGGEKNGEIIGVLCLLAAVVCAACVMVNRR